MMPAKPEVTDKTIPSMKVPPKRKGNPATGEQNRLNFLVPSMKVPPKRKGNDPAVQGWGYYIRPSMKVPPKRKGNT